MLDEALDPTGNVTALSASVNTCVGGSPGVFSGLGMMLVHDGTNTKEIDLSDGTVTHLGTGATLTGATICEEWAIWGLAERFGGETYMVFRHDSGTDGIIRRAVSDGSDETILDIDALETSVGGNAEAADICSIGLSPSRGVWTYHSEDVDSILGMDPALGAAEEAAGACPAEFDAPAP